MAMSARDVAKVLTGVTVHETIGHWWLGLFGAKYLPLKLGGFEFTQEINWGAMAFWPAMVALCVYFGWRRSVGVAAPPGNGVPSSGASTPRSA
jgi:hypothetical protein